MIHGSGAVGRAFFPLSGIDSRLVVKAPRFQPLSDGPRSVPRHRAGRWFIFTIPGKRKLGGDAIDELDSRETAMLGDLEHRTPCLGADFCDRLARVRRATELRPGQLGEMLEVFLSQMGSASVRQRRYVIGVEPGSRRSIEKHGRRGEVNADQTGVSLDSLRYRKTVRGRDP